MLLRRRQVRLLVALFALVTGAVDAAAQEAAHDATPPVSERGARRLLLSRVEKSLHLQLRMDGEILSVLDGGLRTGSVFDAVVHGAAALDTASLGLWRGGRLLGSVVAIRGGSPDARLVGDLQVTSNIAAPSAARVYELWYRQYLPSLPFELRAGLIDCNQYFAVTESAGTLLNASFGITPTISANAPTSIYPKPGLGAMVAGGSSRWQLLAGVFQGNPADRSSALHGGAMTIAELDLHIGGAAGGVAKLGVWRHGAASAGARGQEGAQWGAFGVVERDLAAVAGRTWRGFLQLGATPPHGSVVPAYLGAGVTVTAPLASRPDDTLTLGLARAWIRHGPPETSYELTYVATLGAHLHLQPDLQLVSNPAGTRAAPDALVGTLRLHLVP